MAPPAAAAADAAPQGTDHVVEDAIRDLKKVQGFHGYVILNNDGIVIKYENVSYKTAVHYSHQILGLTLKASKYIRELFDAPDNEVECIRLRTLKHELIVAQLENFTIIATHIKPSSVPEEVVAVAVAGEAKEGEVKAPE